jgi:DNA-binding response OmpR family regulator
MSECQTRILVVDDDPDLRDLLTSYLAREGFAVSGAEGGRAMDAVLAETGADLILLDLMLPGEDGLSIARRLRQATHMPIIMLSARGDEVDRIVGLEVGADDYVAKPFNPRELLARIRAVLRRQAQAHPGAGAQPNDQAGAQPPEDNADDPETFSFGPYRLDLRCRALLKDDGSPIPLTSGELDLLAALVAHPNRVLDRDRLLDLLKGYERSPFDRSIDVQIARLRAKIEPDTKRPRYIRTVWGKGYMFTPLGEG